MCIDKAERLLAEAAGYGAQLIVFPEAFVDGYPRGSNFGVVIGNRTAKGKEEFRKCHAAAINVPGPEVDRLAAMAGKYKVFLVMGVIERDGYTLFCTILFFDSQGCYLGKHRKGMPTALERIIWGFGDGSIIPVFETPIGKIGAAICWKNKMPHLRTAMYANDIEFYCAPTADSRDLWQTSMTHIALEGGCFVPSANQFCRRKDYPPLLQNMYLQAHKRNLLLILLSVPEAVSSSHHQGLFLLDPIVMGRHLSRQISILEK